jgi:nitrogen fixation NifU-like protein
MPSPSPSRRPRAISGVSVPEREPSLLDDLYKEIILDHYRNPRNKGTLAAPSCSADGANPLCGDQLHLDVEVEDGTIEAIQFSGQGCSISQASASMMTEHVKGKTVDGAEAAIGRFQQMMMKGEPPDEDFGDIEALAGVAKFPVRVKCASLAWKTLQQAIERPGERAAVTTDERSAANG